MSAHVLEIERLREEIEALRAAVSERDRDILARDRSITERDRKIESQGELIVSAREQLLTLARAHRVTQEELDLLRRRFFGKKSEKLPAGPTLFDEEPLPEVSSAPADEGSTLTPREVKQARRKSGGRKPFPAHLPRVLVEYPLAAEDLPCADCGEDRKRIGEDRSETLEFVPQQVRVLVHVRGRYVCPRHPDQGVLTPPAPPRPIPGSYAGPALLSHVLVSKFDDHLPLYRLSEIFKRFGLELSRSTLCDWVAGVMPLLEPVAEAVRRSVLAESYLQADETPLLVQQGPEGRPKDAYLWTYRAGVTGEIFFDFRLGRGREGPLEILAEFHGTLQVDGYAGYDESVRRNSLMAAGCMAHARRRFFEAIDSSPAEASIVLILIRRLYKVEERGREVSLEQRAALRREESAAIMKELRLAIEGFAAEALPAGRLGKACSYALNQWTRLEVFLEDPRVEIDNNSIERHIRSVAVGRKNWMFCGNEEGGRRAAVLFTLIESCKAAGVEPFAYLTDLLTRIPALPAHRPEEFTPRAWAAAKTVTLPA